MARLDALEREGKRIVDRLSDCLPDRLVEIRDDVHAAVAKVRENAGYFPLNHYLPLPLRVDYLKKSLLTPTHNLSVGRIEMNQLFSEKETPSVQGELREWILAHDDFPMDLDVFVDLCFLLDAVINDHAFSSRIFKKSFFQDSLSHYIESFDSMRGEVLLFLESLIPVIPVDELIPFTIGSARLLNDFKMQLSQFPAPPGIVIDYLALFAKLASYPSADPLLRPFIAEVKAELQTVSNAVLDRLEADSAVNKELIIRVFGLTAHKTPAAPLERAIKSPMGLAVLNFVRQEQPKKALFSQSPALEAFRHPQEWITVNPPERAKSLYVLVRTKLPSEKMHAFHRTLSTYLKKPIAQLNADDFMYYADEILDAIKQFVPNSPLQKDSEIAAALEACNFGFRYAQRVEEDLKSGNKTGDCTAVGSINFENSLTWYVNPLYQMMVLKQGSRFLGRLNFTIGLLDKTRILLVDAVEFNPQADSGTEEGGDHSTPGPYYLEAQVVFKEALCHLLELAKKEGRRLIVHTRSNSSNFEKEVGDCTIHQTLSSKASLQVNNPVTEVGANLRKRGYGGPVKLWYQSAESTGAQAEYVTEANAPAGALDKIPARLEREVFNPAQGAYPAVADAIRARDFTSAATLVLGLYPSQLKSIFGLSPDVGLLVRKLEQVYPAAPLSSAEKFHAIRIDTASFIEVTAMAA